MAHRRIWRWRAEAVITVLLAQGAPAGVVGGMGGVSTRARLSPACACAAGSGNPPPRVSANSPVSVRKQIQLARYFKQLEQADTKKGKQRVKTRFRRAKSNNRSGPLGDEVVSPGQALPTVLLVDGYNIIGYWPTLKKLRDDGQMARARDMLLARITDYAYYMSWKVVLVFDAAGNADRASGEDSVETTPQGIELVFSAEAADTYIGEQSKALLTERQAASVFVATADFALQQTVEGNRAHVISARQLVNQVTGLQKTIARQVQASNVEAAAGFGAFADHLDAKSLDALSQIERKLAASGQSAKPRKARPQPLGHHQSRQLRRR